MTTQTARILFWVIISLLYQGSAFLLQQHEESKVLRNLQTDLNFSTQQSTQQIANPILRLGREEFINWSPVEIRQPTDVYLVMIELFMDSNVELPEIFHHDIDSILAVVQGRMSQQASTLQILQWIEGNSFENFVQGHIIDILNVNFYRLQYQIRSTQNIFEAFFMIHKYNFQVTPLKIVMIEENTPTSDLGIIVQGPLAEAETKIQSLRRQIKDLELKMYTKEESFSQKELQILLYQGFYVMSQQTVNQDIGCLLIKHYIRTQFGEFVSIVRADSPDRTYTYLNFQIQQIYLKRVDSERIYLLRVTFGHIIDSVVEFRLSRIFSIQGIKKVY